MSDEEDQIVLRSVEKIIGHANREIDGWSAVNDTDLAITSLFDTLLEQSKSDQAALKAANQRINNLHTLLGRLIERTP